MTHPLSSLISSQHTLELEAHVSVDNTIAKVYEESHELEKARAMNNPEEIEKEARDVLINILSVSSRYIDIESLSLNGSRVGDIPALIARWGRETASIRNRYSREKVSLEEFRDTTWAVISALLPLAGGNIRNAVMSSLEKFRSRIRAYLPDINLREHIAEYPDFPKPGILFRDISPLLAHPEVLRYASYEMARQAEGADIIAWLDARGFIFGSRVAEILGKPFVMIRKKWKLPGETVGTDYSLEYGNNSIEIQKNAIPSGSKVAIIDDLLATGGTLCAAVDLVEKVWVEVHSLICLISLDEAFLREQPSRRSIESRYNTVGILRYDN